MEENETYELYPTKGRVIIRQDEPETTSDIIVTSTEKKLDRGIIVACHPDEKDLAVDMHVEYGGASIGMREIKTPNGVPYLVMDSDSVLAVLSW